MSDQSIWFMSRRRNGSAVFARLGHLVSVVRHLQLSTTRMSRCDIRYLRHVMFLPIYVELAIENGVLQTALEIGELATTASMGRLSVEFSPPALYGCEQSEVARGFSTGVHTILQLLIRFGVAAGLIYVGVWLLCDVYRRIHLPTILNVRPIYQNVTKLHLACRCTPSNKNSLGYALPVLLLPPTLLLVGLVRCTYCRTFLGNTQIRGLDHRRSWPDCGKWSPPHWPYVRSRCTRRAL